MSSIHYLAGRGDPFELLALLEAGADPNGRGLGGKTPLMHAAKGDNRVAARLLLKWGLDIDAVDEGRTALHGASERKMKRLLLDAGADSDRGRIRGMTLMAFFATFRDRELIELFLSYRANPDETTRKGPSVRALLDDHMTVWTDPSPMNNPERRASSAKAILQLSDGLRLTAKAFVSEHRNILIWSFGSYAYDDPTIAAWASRVGDLFGDPDRLEAAYRQHLEGEELDSALRSLVRPRLRAEREKRRKNRAAMFAALHLDGDEPQETP